MLVAVNHAVRDDSIVGLTNDSNQKVKKQNHIDSKVEEPDNPNEVDHSHREVPVPSILIIFMLCLPDGILWWIGFS